MTFMALREVIYMDVGGYKGKVGKSDKVSAGKESLFGGIDWRWDLGRELLNFLKIMEKWPPYG
jgi:hypothetical protein